MELAWSGPPPVLPEKWISPDYLESHDAYVAFSGKLWHDVPCSDLPRYFNALTWFTTDDTLKIGVPGYYLASYMRCIFLSTGDGKDFAIDNVEYFLEMAVENPLKFGLSQARCSVIAFFLELKLEEFENWDASVVDKWRLVAGSPPPYSPAARERRWRPSDSWIRMDS